MVQLETRYKMVGPISHERSTVFDWIMTEPFCSQLENMAMTGMKTQETPIEFSSW